jgi:hypothetical protein
MLEDRARVYPGIGTGEGEEEKPVVKSEPNNELKTELVEEAETEMKPNIVKQEEREEPRVKRRRRGSSGERHGHGERGRRHRSRSRSPVEEAGKFSREKRRKRREEADSDKAKAAGEEHAKTVAPVPVMDDLTEEVRRMEIIRQILRRRNDGKAIEEARQRYLARREMGEIVPPF